MTLLVCASKAGRKVYVIMVGEKRTAANRDGARSLVWQLVGAPLVRSSRPKYMPGSTRNVQQKYEWLARKVIAVNCSRLQKPPGRHPPPVHGAGGD